MRIAAASSAKDVPRAKYGFVSDSRVFGGSGCCSRRQRCEEIVQSSICAKDGQNASFADSYEAELLRRRPSSEISYEKSIS